MAPAPARCRRSRISGKHVEDHRLREKFHAESRTRVRIAAVEAQARRRLRPRVSVIPGVRAERGTRVSIYRGGRRQADGGAGGCAGSSADAGVERQTTRWIRGRVLMWWRGGRPPGRTPTAITLLRRPNATCNLAALTPGPIPSGMPGQPGAPAASPPVAAAAGGSAASAPGARPAAAPGACASRPVWGLLERRCSYRCKRQRRAHGDERFVWFGSEPPGRAAVRLAAR